MTDDGSITAMAGGQPPTDDHPRRLTYRVLTGPDDATFCQRVSAALADGYVLHGGPALTARSDGTVVVAQAVVLPAG